MTSGPSQRLVSPLRARMIEDMTVRGFKEDTRRDYVRQRPSIRGLYRPVARHGESQSHPAESAFPDTAVGSACTSSFSRLARRSLAFAACTLAQSPIVTAN